MRKRISMILIVLLFAVLGVGSAQESSWEVGDLVEVEWDGEWYAATIAAVEGGEYLVTWDDGTEDWVAAEYVRSPMAGEDDDAGQGQAEPGSQWSIGDSVEAEWDGEWYAATIAAVEDGEYLVAWDDGTEDWLNAAYVRAPGSGPDPSGQTGTGAQYSVGEVVEAYDEGEWYRATIQDEEDGEFLVAYDDGAEPNWKTPESLRRASDTGPVTPEQQPASADIEDFLLGLGSWEAFAEALDKLKSDEPRHETGPTEVEQGVDYSCRKTPMSMTSTPEKLVTLDPGEEKLFPGNLLEGRGYAEGLGSFKELPIRQRAPLTISINLLTADNTRTIANPSLSTVNKAIGELIDSAMQNEVRSGSDIYYESVVANSVEQVAADFGLSIDYLAGSVKTKFGFSRSTGKNSVMVKFTQNMFTVAMEEPQTPAALFQGFTVSDLEKQIDMGRIGSENLPVYVGSVTFGRTLLYKMTSSMRANEMKGALDAAYKGGAVSVEGSAATNYNKLVNESETTLTVIGGEEEHALRAIRSGDIREFFAEGSDLQSARPISYTIRNVSDNSLAKVSTTAEYTLTECTPLTAQDHYQVAAELHGPGGLHFGDWAGSWDMCPTGQFAVGFEQMVEPYQASGDDTGMNGLRLLCGTSSGPSGDSVTSRMAGWGAPMPTKMCGPGQVLTGYSLKVEPHQGGDDDTAANGIRMYCRDLSQATGVHKNLHPDSQHEGRYGAWKGPYYTPANQAICGLVTNVEGDQGGGDDTALGDVKFRTCWYAPQ